MNKERASIFDEDDLDLSGFAPAPSTRPKADKEVLRTVAESRGFSSREPTPVASAPAAEPPPMPPSALPAPTSRRHRTGRNRQLNLKVTGEALERFYALADSERLVLGEAFERAVYALEREIQASRERESAMPRA